MMDEDILEVRALTRTFSSGTSTVAALQDVSLQVHPGEFLSILGPSGSGKTTLLRLIAGLERPDVGTIRIGGAVVSDAASGLHLSPDRRGLSMVFQSGGIWPHMTVFENVAFPLVAQSRRLGFTRAEIDRRTQAALGRVSLAAEADRRAGGLSGGQQQRVSIARAIVAEPNVVLLDEPLSSLDAKLRDQMRELLVRLQAELKLTILQVTHDQADALAMSHRVAVMNDGRIVQVGSPEELYRRPASRFVAEFIGDGAILRIDGSDVLVRPEDVDYSAGPHTDPAGWIPVTTLSSLYHGGRRRLKVKSELGTVLVDVAAHEPVAESGFIRIAGSRGVPIKT